MSDLSKGTCSASTDDVDVASRVHANVTGRVRVRPAAAMADQGISDITGSCLQGDITHCEDTNVTLVIPTGTEIPSAIPPMTDLHVRG